MCSNLSFTFSFSLLIIQLDFYLGHQYVHLPGLLVNRTLSTVVSSGTEVVCTNHSAMKTHFCSVQQNVYRQAI